MEVLKHKKFHNKHNVMTKCAEISEICRDFDVAFQVEKLKPPIFAIRGRDSEGTAFVFKMDQNMVLNTPLQLIAQTIVELQESALPDQ